MKDWITLRERLREAEREREELKAEIKERNEDQLNNLEAVMDERDELKVEVERLQADIKTRKVDPTERLHRLVDGLEYDKSERWGSKHPRKEDSVLTFKIIFQSIVQPFIPVPNSNFCNTRSQSNLSLCIS